MATTFPIDVTSERLIEFLSGPGLGTIRTIAEQEIGRDPFVEPSPTADDSCGVTMLLMALNGATGEDLRAWLHDSQEAIDYRTKPPEPPKPVGTEAGAIYVERPTMRDETGAVWQWRGFTDFLLFYRFLCGVDIQPFLDERIALGANVLRVFSMVGWDECNPRFYPANFPSYWPQLRAFAETLAASAVRLELTVFADAQIVMPDADDRKAHLRQVLQTLAGMWNVFIEIANEPWQNLPGGDQEAIDLALDAQGHGLLVASGEYNSWPPAPGADYGNTHCPRTEDWPRKSKDLMERCDNSDKTPWIGDEPMGAAEVTEPGRRDADPNNHAWYAATCAMWAPGATFHCEAGIHSFTPVPPVQTECARAFFWALDWMPNNAILMPYQRGDQGNEAGYGEMPILHDDALESRSYCKGDGSTEWCCQIQTRRVDENGNYAPVARDGWRIVETPRLGFVKLVKP